jgi:hypothetical protein
MKGRTVTLAKSTPGVTEEVHLQTNAVLPTSIDLLTNEKAVRGALSCGDRPAEARKAILEAAKKAGISLPAKDVQAVQKACATICAQKGLYEVGWLGSMLEDLHWLCLQSEWERDSEDDGSKVPEGLREAWMQLIAQFKEMAIEEADELTAAGGKGEKGMKITDQAGLTKAGKSIMDHLENVKSAHEKTGEHIEKCMKACKEAIGGEMEEKSAPVPAVTAVVVPEASKALETKVEELMKSVADLTKSNADLMTKLAATPAPGGPASGAGAQKTIDAPAELVALLN